MYGTNGNKSQKHIYMKFTGVPLGGIIAKDCVNPQMNHIQPTVCAKAAIVFSGLYPLQHA